MPKLTNEKIKEILSAIINLLNYQNYNLALKLLENLLQNVEPNTKEYLYAQVLLLDAYHCTGMSQQAMNLCQELSNSEYHITRVLAQYYLGQISPETNLTEEESSVNLSKDLLTTAQAAELITAGYQALTQKQYTEAIAKLEKFCQGADPNTKQYLQAHKWLVKAYQENGQIDRAIALCQPLLIHQYEAIRKWARHLLYTKLFIHNFTPPVLTLNTEEAIFPAKLEVSDLPEASEIDTFTPKTLKEFKTFCQTTLVDELKTLESLRKQVLYSVIVSQIIALFLGFALIKAFPIILTDLKFTPDSHLGFWFFNIGSLHIVIPFLFIIVLAHYLLIFLFIFWLWILFYNSAFETFSHGLKSKINEKIFTFFNENKNLKYINTLSSENISKSFNYFQHSQLFQGLLKPNKIIQDDYIEGEVNGVNIWFSNIHAELQLKHYWTHPLDITFFMSNNDATIIDVNSFRNFLFSILRILYFFTFLLPFTFYIGFLLFRFFKLSPYLFNNILQGKNIDYKKFESEILRNEVTRTNVVFKGIFFKAKFNKNVKTATIVQPKSISLNIHALNHGTKQLIKLEDPEFARLFTVYADDQVEARYVLSTSLMEKIIKFRQKTNRNIYLSFVDDMIYIAIEQLVDNEIFEPNLYKSTLRFAPLQEYFENMNLVLGIVEDLNLHTRIWHPR
ncbi:DUF3137 domain-containing protein [Calothrix sp. NIES-2098]|uniref:DUF3137 domain-containing protein n=1 Tax=Calothrix sp. NIES-2098 TaxID=1954171 RepID=UPI000B5DFBE9|nr:putative Galanin [Calothrix sp. NIES-2098]